EPDEHHQAIPIPADHRARHRPGFPDARRLPGAAGPGPGDDHFRIVGSGCRAIGQHPLSHDSSPDLPGDRFGRVHCHHDGADRHLATPGLDDVARCLWSVGDGAVAGHRSRGQRLDALDRLQLLQRTAFGNRQGLRGDLPRRVSGASSERSARELDGFFQAVHCVAADGRPAADGAGFRRHGGDDGRRGGDAVPRRCRAVSLHPDGGAGGRSGDGAGAGATLPDGASDHVYRPVGRPVRFRLSIDPGPDRLRSRRMAGRRPGQQRAEAVLSARSPHRLRVFGIGRGTGRGRFAAHRRVVRLRLCARHVHRFVGRAGQAVFRRVRGVWLVVPVDRSVPDQHRRERRPVANQRPDAAVPQLRRQFPGDLLCLSGLVAAHRMGESNPPGQRRDGIPGERLRRGADSWAL
ncbi:Peptidoglycan glycosyltransferase FtsW (EC 2.4.1.129), partial [Pseudomonas sp. FG-3G]